MTRFISLCMLKNSHLNQYIELYTNEASEVSLENYALVICDMEGRRSASLDVRAVVDLSSGKIQANSHLALITNDPNLQSSVAKFPNSGVWRIFGQQMNGENWLTIKEENVVAIFLLYTSGQNLFEIFKKEGKYVKLDDIKLDFVRKNILDFLIVKHAMGPNSCSIINDVLSELTGPVRTTLNHYLPQHKPFPGTMVQSMSINRCGNENLFDIRAYKHGSRQAYYRRKSNIILYEF